MREGAVKSTDTHPSSRNLAHSIRHGLKIARAEPKFAAGIIGALVASRVHTRHSPKILVGTHHKILTVYMGNVFRSFAQITNRSISVGTGGAVDYSADIIVDHHSLFDFSRIDFEHVGLHIRRDPRDIVISSGFYHRRSAEKWLHVPREEFAGKTYQQYVNAMAAMEDVFLFELDHSAGTNIRQLLDWNYDRGFLELKYEDLVSPHGGRMFRHEINHWPLSTLEKSLLEGIFNYHSLFGSRVVKNGHVRDPSSRQFEQLFTEKLHQEFVARFPDALSKLGYS